MKCQCCDKIIDYERYLKHLKIFYLCKNPGCEYKGDIDGIKAHVKICEKRTYYCDLKDNGCHWIGYLTELSEHSNTCRFNKCPFENCKFIGTLHKLKKHKENYHYNYKQEACKFNCGFIGTNSEMINHYKNCIEKIKNQQEEVFFSEFFEQNVSLKQKK